MKRIRISHFGSSICIFLLSLIYLLGAPLFIEVIKSDVTKPNVSDVIIPLYLLFYFGGVVFLCFAFISAKYCVLDENGILLCFLGITYRKIAWSNIYDVMVGPDPFGKYTNKTLLLNCQPEIKYRPHNHAVPAIYEKSLYKDLFRGKIIRLRCGRKLDAVLILLNEYVGHSTGDGTVC